MNAPANGESAGARCCRITALHHCLGDQPLGEDLLEGVVLRRRQSGLERRDDRLHLRVPLFLVEELRKHLWPEDTFVDFEHSLNTHIKKLRQVFDDDAETPRYIETLPRRGYRFIAQGSPESRRIGNA